MRQADGKGPVEPRWVLTKDELPPGHGMLKTTCDPESDWLLMSGGFVAGREHRPAGGPKHDPHWGLLTSGPMAGGVVWSGGWAESIDAAKEHLLAAWQAWLRWAELAA